MADNFTEEKANALIKELHKKANELEDGFVADNVRRELLKINMINALVKRRQIGYTYNPSALTNLVSSRSYPCSDAWLESV